MFREPNHSKGGGGNDQHAMVAVVSALARRGCDVRVVTTPHLGCADLGGAEVLLSMARTIESLSALAQIDGGTAILNDPTATLATLRERLYPALVELGVRFPETRLVKVGAPVNMAPPYWLKRKDYHHVVDGDVQLVGDPAGARLATAHFLGQGYARMFAQRHVTGQRIKFYAVCARPSGRVLFLRTLEPAADRIVDELYELATVLANHLDLEIFGGDVIAAADGLWLIDVNAWPSFKSCAHDAAEAIADYTLARWRACRGLVSVDDVDHHA